jgi:hypothetical protein
MAALVHANGHRLKGGRMTATDPQHSPPSATAVAQVAELTAQVRQRILAPSLDEPPLVGRFGLGILDLLSLRPADVIGTRKLTDIAPKLYEQIATAFLDHVLPRPEDLPAMDAGHVAEWLKALRTETPNPGLLATAFGIARLREFGTDRRLIYRSGSYRGRSGDPLADHLIERVIRPAVRACGIDDK